jgi:two-component system, LytTR family, response regulator
MKINIVLCDDESIALRINCTYIEELVKKFRIDANILGFLRGEKLLEFMENNIIDIAFLDIDLKGTNGLTIASKLQRKNPKVITIFISGHREYAFDAFSVEAFGFLAKPVDAERLERVFKKAVIQLNYLSNRAPSVPLIITVDNIKKKINQSCILYIERKNTQSVIHAKTGNFCVYETITSLVGRLDKKFIQINQGMIINMDEIETMRGIQVDMKNGDVFPIGRTYSKDVKKKYLEYPRV